MDAAFKYIIERGICKDLDYSYTGVAQVCKQPPCKDPIKITGFVDVPGCDNLLNALAGRPISVAVDASNWSSYKSGILKSCGTSLNHGV